MVAVYISIGSNIDPERNVPAAVMMLREEVRVAAISTFYRTAPIGSPGAPHFYNGVVRIETDIPPHDLKQYVLRVIEKRLGREHTADKYAPRTIDLDIALYDDLIVDELGVVIPDPDIEQRAFIAVPLLELDPDLVLPGSGTKLSEIAARLQADDMVPLIDFTRILRWEIENEP